MVLKNVISSMFLSGLAIASLPLQAAFADAPAGVTASMPLTETAGSPSLRVRIVATPNGCTWGDYDAIQMDLAKMKSPRLIVSFEPIGSKGEAQVRDISSFDLTKGFVTTFNVGKAATPQHYGLFICTDQAKKGRCSEKPVTPPESVIDSHLTGIDKETGVEIKQPSDKPAEEKAYYFAYVLVQKGAATVLKDLMQVEDYTAMGKYMSEIGAPPAILKTVEAKNDEMNSVQPKVTKDALNINLPKVDQAACPKQ